MVIFHSYVKLPEGTQIISGQNRYVSKFLMVQSHFFDGYPPVKERCGTPIIRWFSGREIIGFPYLCVCFTPGYSVISIPWNPYEIAINPNETRWNPYEISIFLSLVTISLWFSCRCPMGFPHFARTWHRRPVLPRGQKPAANDACNTPRAPWTLRMMSPLSPWWALKPQQKFRDFTKQNGTLW